MKFTDQELNHIKFVDDTPDDVIQLKADLEKTGFYGKGKMKLQRRKNKCELRYRDKLTGKFRFKSGTVEEVRQTALFVLKSHGITI